MRSSRRPRKRPEPFSAPSPDRIALYEAGAEARFLEVDLKNKRLRDGADFRRIHPLGLVPTLRTDGGEVLTENAAILQYVADRFSAANLAGSGLERSRLQQWLCFIGAELHKGLFIPLLDASCPEPAKSWALEKGVPRFDYLERRLTGRETLLDRFSVADAYLCTVLNWTQAIPAIDLGRWPAVLSYLSAMRKRPSVARVISEETSLWREEQARLLAS